MEELGINESAIKIDFDKVQLSKLNSMLGEMRAIPIDEYIVMYNPKRYISSEGSIMKDTVIEVLKGFW